MIQQDHLQIFDLTLNVWAPLFVGNGSSCTKKKSTCTTPAMAKSPFWTSKNFFSFLVERDLVDKYEQFMLSDQSNLWAFLTKDCGISDVELKTLTRYQIVAGDALDAKHSLKGIHAFQRDAQGHAYIPGSSIKGALRTAWLLSAVLAGDRSTGHSLAPNRRATFPEEKYVNQLHLRTLKDGSIASDAVNSIFRGIQISDSLSIPDNCMMLAGKTDSATDGGTHSINLCRECVAPGTAIRFKLTLDQSVLKGRITKKTLCWNPSNSSMHPISRPTLGILPCRAVPSTAAAAALSDPGRRLRVLCQVASISLSWRKKKVCAGQQSKWRRCSVNISMSVMPKMAFPRTP